MQIDALALRLRPRTSSEAIDLGIRLCQANAATVYRIWAAVALPFFALLFLLFENRGWAMLVLWWWKPWLDRTILFVLSRAAFGQPTRLRDLWQAKRQHWWHRIGHTLTVRRYSPWRSFTEPVYALEGLSLAESGRRIRKLRSGQLGPALMALHTFVAAEVAIELSLLALLYMLVPQSEAPDVLALITGESQAFALVLALAYAAAVFIVEPFYVAAGFAQYLNRRADLEAWDIEQELRRAFDR